MTTFAKKIHQHFDINLSQKVISRGQSGRNGSKLTFKMHQNLQNTNLQHQNSKKVTIFGLHEGLMRAKVHGDTHN